VTPRTRQEDRLMGPARDRLAHDLEDAAREPLERAAQAASAAADTAVDTFRSTSSASDETLLSPTQAKTSTQSSSQSVMSSDTGPGPQESGPGVVSPAGYAADGANTRSDIDAAVDETPAVGRDLTPSDDRRPGSEANPLGGR
jgi:hypothetical protein